MDYGFFYDVAEYGNANWKGGFSPKEVAENAYEYLCEWEFTMRIGVATSTIETLMEQLHEDLVNGNEKAEEFLDEIKYQLRRMREYDDELKEV